MINEYVLRNFEYNYPGLARDAVDISPHGDFGLRVTMPNGDIWEYDNHIQRARGIPRNMDNLTEEECKREFGYRLRILLLREHMSQGELSEKTGIPMPIINKYINGKTNPGFYNVDKIAKALSCSVDELRCY